MRACNCFLIESLLGENSVLCYRWSDVKSGSLGLGHSNEVVGHEDSLTMHLLGVVLFLKSLNCDLQYNRAKFEFSTGWLNQ